MKGGGGETESTDKSFLSWTGCQRMWLFFRGSSGKAVLPAWLRATTGAQQGRAALRPERVPGASSPVSQCSGTKTQWSSVLPTHLASPCNPFPRCTRIPAVQGEPACSGAADSPGENKGPTVTREKPTAHSR